MLSNKLRQLAINTTENGCIGKGKKLLFSSPADLSRFAKFTRGTVLIVGKHTAEQMIEAGARVNRNRPLMVITKDGHVPTTHTTIDDEKWIYYASSLKEALEAAEGLVLELNLNGWTIAGGKQVYDEFFQLLAKTSMRLTSAYAFVHESEPKNLIGGVRLDIDWQKMEALICRNMASPRSIWNQVDSIGLLPDGSRARAKNPRAISIYDASYIDPWEAALNGDVLTVVTTTGPMHLDRHFIKGWHTRDGVNSVTLVLPNSEVTIRPQTSAGLNSLLFALNVSAHY